MAQQPVSLSQLQNAPAPAEQSNTKLLDLLSNPKVQQGFASVIGNAMKPERMLGLCIAAAKGNPKLLDCEPKSVLGAMMAAAALGLEPNTPQQQAYLIPYAKRGKLADGTWGVVGYDCQFQIGYRGYITLAHRSPHIAYLQAECVHENDLFEHLVGSTSFLKFQKKLGNRGAPVGAFAFVKFTNGSEAACVLDMDELEKIRECSDTYTSLRERARSSTKKVGKRDVPKNEYDIARDKQKLAETPWVMWFDDMAAKSAIKKLVKQLPMEQGSALATATELDREGKGDNVIDMAQFTDPSVARGVVIEGDAPPVLVAEDDGDGDGLDIPAVVGEQREAVSVDTSPANLSGHVFDAEPEPAAQAAPAPQASAPTAGELITRALKAADTDELMSILADAEHLPEEQQRKVSAKVNARRAELEHGSAQMSLG